MIASVEKKSFPAGSIPLSMTVTVDLHKTSDAILDPKPILHPFASQTQFSANQQILADAAPLSRKTEFGRPFAKVSHALSRRWNSR